jgi:hypothetical protein
MKVWNDDDRKTGCRRQCNDGWNSGRWQEPSSPFDGNIPLSARLEADGDAVSLKQALIVLLQKIEDMSATVEGQAKRIDQLEHQQHQQP